MRRRLRRGRAGEPGHEDRGAEQVPPRQVVPPRTDRWRPEHFG
jgi:hypothetical protein